MESDTESLPPYGAATPPARRSRRLTRVLICAGGAVLLILVGLATTDIVLTARYGDQVQQKLQQLHAAGKPLTAPELAPPPVPDAENAAPLYLKAADIVAPHAGRPAGPWGPNEAHASRVVGYSEADWGNPRDMAILAGLLRQDREALDLVSEATNRPGCVLDINWQSAPHLDDLSKMRAVGRFLRAATLVASDQGDQAEAFRRIRLGLALSRHVAEEPTFYAFAESQAITAYSVRAGEYAISHGPWPDGPARRLAKDLRPAAPAPDPVRLVESDRVMGLESFEFTGAGLTWRPTHTILTTGGDSGPLGDLIEAAYDSPASPLLQPVYYRDELLYLGLVDRLEPLVRKPWREVAATGDQLVSESEHLPDWALVTRDNGVWIEVGVRRHREAEQLAAQQELLQLVLGLKVYRQRTGAYPENLDPLRAMDWPVPLDRFSGKPFIYHHQEDCLQLYSIGPDLKDDGGRPMLSICRTRAEESLAASRTEPYAGDIVWMEWPKE